MIGSSAVTVLKFGHMSSDLLAYGASDGTLTVCTVSDPPSLIQHMQGHTKDVTGWINWYCFCYLICIIGECISACFWLVHELSLLEAFNFFNTNEWPLGRSKLKHATN